MKFLSPKNIMSDMGDDQSLDGFSDDVSKGPVENK